MKHISCFSQNLPKWINYRLPMPDKLEAAPKNIASLYDLVRVYSKDLWILSAPLRRVLDVTRLHGHFLSY